MATKKSTTYVNNQKFYESLAQYRRQYFAAKDANLPEPPIPEFVGECLLKIATRFAYHPRFARYSYKDDFTADAVETMIRYLMNFNPDKSTNPFAYFTQIAYHAFFRRINLERKQQYIKYRMIQKAAIEQGQEHRYQTAEQDYMDFENVQQFISEYEESERQLKARKRAQQKAKKQRKKEKRLRQTTQEAPQSWLLA